MSAPNFSATHECTRCLAQIDRRNVNYIQSRRGVPNQDCLIDIRLPNGHNYQSTEDKAPESYYQRPARYQGSKQPPRYQGSKPSYKSKWSKPSYQSGSKWSRQDYRSQQDHGPKPSYQTNYNWKKYPTNFNAEAEINKPIDIAKFIPKIYKYKKKSEFEKVEYLLCWARLKHNEKVLDGYFESLKWKYAFNYLYNIEFTPIERAIVSQNMQSHESRIKFFKSINKHGVKNAIEICKIEHTFVDNPEISVELKDNDSDNDVINDLDINQFESTTKGITKGNDSDDDVINDLDIETIEQQVEYGQELAYNYQKEEEEDMKNIELDNEQRVSRPLTPQPDGKETEDISLIDDQSRLTQDLGNEALLGVNSLITTFIEDIVGPSHTESMDDDAKHSEVVIDEVVIQQTGDENDTIDD